MVTKVLRSADDLPALSRFIEARGKFPLTITIENGALRSHSQNRLAQRWNADIARQRGDTDFESVRAFNKVVIGAPILLEGNDAFRVQWERVLGPLSYEERLEAVKQFDLPITRLMSAKQMSAYMDSVQQYWTEKGFWLTSPDDLGREEAF